MNLLSKECLAEVKDRAYEGARASQLGVVESSRVSGGHERHITYEAVAKSFKIKKH